MATYTNLGIKKITTGDESGTWGTSTNTNFDYFDTAIVGYTAVTLPAAGNSGSPNTINVADFAASDGRNRILEFVDAGDLGAPAYVQITPNDFEGYYFIQNSLSGGRSIFLFQGNYDAARDYEIENGKDVVVRCTGNGTTSYIYNILNDLQIGTLKASLAGSTGLPISTGVSGLGTGVATALGINTGTAGSFLVNGGSLGTPSSIVLTNGTGLPVTTGISGLGTNVATFLATPSSANLAAAVTDETGTGSLVFSNSPTLVTPALGIPSALTLTNATGLPVTTGISGLGTNVATFLATPSSANLAAAVTGETGSGALVFGTSPSLTTPALSGETFSTSATFTAGANAQNQGPISSDYNVITTASANPSGVTLPAATAGRRIVIVNKGANSVNVYPASGASIDALAADASIALPTNGVMTFNAASTTLWYSSFNLYTSATTAAGVTSFSAGSTGFSPSSGTTGAIILSGTLNVANGGTGVTTSTGSGSNVLSTSPTLVTPALGTPSALTLTNATGLPISGITGLGTGVGAALAVNVGSSGAFVTNGGALGTPSSGTLTNATGLPIGGITGLGTGVGAALAVNTGSAGAFVVNGGALGTPSSGTLTNATGLPVSGISGLGTNVATFLATPSSANLASAVTGETGSGALVFGTSPSLSTPALSGETFSTSATFTAGTNAQAQAPMTDDYTVITTADAAPSGATLPTATVGRRVVVVNKSANTVNIYPASGASIDALATNASIALPVDGVMVFNASTTTKWYSSYNIYTSATVAAGVTSFSAGATGFSPNTGTTGAITLSGTLNVSNGGTGVTSATGTGSVVLSTSPTLVTPVLGTPTSGTLTNCTGLPIAGINGLGTNVATFLATPSSANLAAAVTNETGTGALVFANTPTLVTPVLGTPASGTLTNCTGLPIAGINGLGTGVAAALAINTGSAGAFVVRNGSLGTPSSGTLTSCTGLPIGGITGFGTGVSTALGVNVGAAGSVVLNGGALGTPSSGTVTNLTGTASININGTVGADTANTGAFTTISGKNLYLTGWGNVNPTSSAIEAIYIGQSSTATATADTYSAVDSNSNIYGYDTFSHYSFRSKPSISRITAGTSTMPVFKAFSTPGITTSGGVGTQVVTDQYGFAVENNLTAATTNYGFYSDLADSGTSRYNFYAAGSAPNYFAGTTTLAGTVKLSGLTASTALALDASKNVVSVTNTGSGNNVLATLPTLDGVLVRYGTGSAACGVVSPDSTDALPIRTSFYDQIALSSLVTNQHISFLSDPSTTAASFTLASHYGFFADGISKGAGSTVTTQYGFYSRSLMTAADTNYGFYSGLAASGTSRYNFYAAGTAPNYFGGSTVISVTDDTNAALRVTQLGTGNALEIEDSTNVDSSPFIVDATGVLVQGKTTSSSTKLSTSNGSPASQIHAITTAGSSLGLFNYSTSAAFPGCFVFNKSKSGTNGTLTAVTDGDNLGIVQFNGADTTSPSAYAPGATIVAQVDGTVAVDSVPSQILFNTTPSGGTAVQTRLAIRASGNVGIGANPQNAAQLLDLRSTNTALTSDTANNTLRFTDTDTTTAANQPIGKIEFYNSDVNNAAVGAYILSSAVGASGGGTIRFGAAADAGAAAEVARVASTGLTVTLDTAGLGYGTGTGGTVTQATSRTTGVTLNKTNGAITLVSAAGTATWQSFTVTNSTVAATDVVVLSQKSGTDLYMLEVTAVAAGSFRISFATTGGTTTEQPVFNFAVIKAVTA